MKDDGYLSLADVVQMMLVMEGTGALRNESRLVAACMDYMDPDARELRVVERHCNASLLVPYIEAADAAAPDLGAAAGQAAAYLYGECVVDEGVAHSVADGIAEGVARWRGIAWGARPRGASAGRVSSVVGIYVDSKDSLHVAALRVGVGLTHMSVTTGVTEWADANRCPARILGRGDGGRFDALVAASDLSLTRYLGVRGLLRDAGVNVRRWMLPTDAMCLRYWSKYRSQDSYRVLAANFGVDRCTLSLYDCNDAVLECLATARVGRGDIAAGRAGLRKSLDDLICSIELDTRHLSTFAPLHVCVASEEEDSSDAEGVVRASLEGAGVRPVSIEMLTMYPDDIACGLSVQGGALAGDVEGLLMLNKTFFDVLLRGTKGNVFAVERNATIPLSWSERFDYSPDRNGEGVTIGRLTEVVLAEPDGRGIGIPLPDGIVSSLKEVPGRTIKATIAIEHDFQLTLMLKDVSSGGKWECRLEDLLDKARPVSIQRTNKQDGNAHSNDTGQNTHGNSTQSYTSAGERTSASQQTVSQSSQSTTATQTATSEHKWFWVRLVIMAAYIFVCVYIIITITEDTQSWPSVASDAATEAAVLLVRLGTLVLMGMDGKLLYDALGGLGKPASKPNEHENKNGGGMRGCLLTLGVPSIVLFVAIGVFFEFVVPWNYRVPFLFLAVLAFPLLIARLSEFSQLKWGE